MSNIKIPKLNIGGKKQPTARGTNRSTRRSNMQSNRSIMSESRRNKLLSIQKREKLKALLVRKFRMQYGTAKQMDKIILKAIDGFVKRQRVTEVDLDNLGKTIASAAKQLGITPNSKSSNTLSSSNNVGGKGPKNSSISASASAPTLNQQLPLSSTRHSKKVLAPIVRTPQQTPQQTTEEVPEDWTLIFRYQQKIQSEEEAKKKKQLLAKRSGILGELKSLSDAKNIRQKKAKELDEEYSKSVQENMKKWKLEEDEKRRKRASVIKEQSLQRKKQMEDRQKRQEEERKRKLQYETNLMKRLNRETEQQLERERLKKINDKKRLVVFLAGNAEHRKRKDALIAKEREEDVERMKQYAALLKKQEDARIEFFKGRSAKMDLNASKNVEARKEEFEAQRQRELRDLRFQKEKDDAIVEEQRKKAAWRKKNQEDINRWLNNSIKAKEEARKKEKSMYIEINNYAKQKAAEVRKIFFFLYL